MVCLRVCVTVMWWFHGMKVECVMVMWWCDDDMYDGRWLCLWMCDGVWWWCDDVMMWWCDDDMYDGRWACLWMCDGGVMLVWWCWDGGRRRRRRTRRRRRRMGGGWAAGWQQKTRTPHGDVGNRLTQQPPKKNRKKGSVSWSVRLSRSYRFLACIGSLGLSIRWPSLLLLRFGFKCGARKQQMAWCAVTLQKRNPLRLCPAQPFFAATFAIGRYLAWGFWQERSFHFSHCRHRFCLSLHKFARP